MDTQQFNPDANHASARLPAGAGVRGGRWLAVATAIVFCVSSVFPAAAGLARNTALFPSWWGPVDVGIAFLLGLLALVLLTLARSQVDRRAREAAYGAYRVLIHGVFAALVLFVLCGDRIVWAQCLTGFAWRYWLMLYCLPEWFTAVTSPSGA
jgi:hypothetical protein